MSDAGKSLDEIVTECTNVNNNMGMKYEITLYIHNNEDEIINQHYKLR